LFLRKAIKLRKTTYNKKQLSSDCIVGWKLRMDTNENVIEENEEEELELEEV